MLPRSQKWIRGHPDHSIDGDQRPERQTCSSLKYYYNILIKLIYKQCNYGTYSCTSFKLYNDQMDDFWQSVFSSFRLCVMTHNFATPFKVMI